MTHAELFGDGSHKARCVAPLAAACVAIVLSAIFTAAAGATPAHRSLPRETVPAGFDYFYATASQYASASGAYGSYLVEDPSVSPDYAPAKAHSLAELAVESSDTEQIIEVGWMVSPQQFGDTLSHLFVYHWVNGVSTCYNGCGFVPTSTTTTAGMTLTSHQVSVFRIAYANSNWNIYDNGTLFGYFPESLWSGTFTSLNAAQWFGEVAVPSPVSVPCAQMGNGAPAGAAGVATISNMGFVEGSATVPAAALTTEATNPAYYSVAESSPDSISFGGPGGCAVASTTTITSVTPTHPVAGTPIEINVSVAGSSLSPGSQAPTGVVTVSGGTNSCQATLSGTGGVATGSCPITDKVPGSLVFAATYSGDANFLDSATTSTPVVVIAAPIRRASITIHFPSESSSLSAAQAHALTTFAKRLGPGASVELVGYATGNRALAFHRAHVVARYLSRTVKIHATLRAATTTPQNKVTAVASWRQS